LKYALNGPEQICFCVDWNAATAGHSFIRSYRI